MSNFTDEQLNVIRHRGGNLLVSAGAGSGKTTTMTERIISLLRGDNGFEPIHLSNLIVLTFTDAAAKNIKEKIIKELSNKESLIEELNHIEEADISTFDAFCHKFVKKYSSKSILPKNFTIGDSIFFNVKAKTFINEILLDYYNNPTYQNSDFYKNNSNTDTFIKILENTSKGKNDDNLVKNLLDYYKAINNEIDVDKYLSTYMDTYFSKDYAEYLLHISVDYIRELVGIALNLDILDKNLIKKAADDKKDEEAIQFIYSTIDQFNSFLSIKNDEEAFKYFHTFAKNDSGSGSIKKVIGIDITKQYNFIKTDIFDNASRYNSKGNEVTDRLFYNVFFEMDVNSLEPVDAFHKTIRGNKEYYKFINDVMIELHKKMKIYKKEYSIYEFQDIEKEAIRILENNLEIRNLYKKNINEIIIDEYQDTNDIQSYLISLISNNNEVVVGDIKQSIYGFRNANPEIFNKRSKDYQSDTNKGLVIPLNKNFRSRKEEVLDQVNKIFIDKANDKSCDVHYFKELLEYGNHNYDSHNDLKNTFRIIKYYGPSNVKEGKGKLTKQLANEIIAQDIKLRLYGDDKQKVIHEAIDKNGNKNIIYENAQESDFLVLGRTNVIFKDIKKVFEDYKLASTLPKSTTFIKSEEVIFIKHSLRLIDLMSQKKTDDIDFLISLSSILRSFVVEAKDNEIGKMMLLSRQTSNIEAFKNCFNYIYKIYEEATNEYKKNGIYSALQLLLHSPEIRIYEKIAKLVKTESKETKINYFLDQLNSYSKTGLTPSEVIDYLDNISKDDEDLDTALQSFETPSCLTGMTIHKSKGLEAPFVYLMNISTQKVTYPKYIKGFGYSMFGEINDIKYELMKKLYNKETNKEKLRLLYVALTRAKESITVLVDGDKISELFGLYNSATLASLLFLDYEPTSIEEIHYEDFYKNKDEFMNKYGHLTGSHAETDKETSIPHYIDLNVPNMEVIERKRASHDLYEIDDEIKKVLEKGTLLHSYYEIADFLVSDLDKELEFKKIPKEYSKYLHNFKNQIIFDSKCVSEFHELPYYENGVNGIIDYLLEKEDEFLIIDFKTKNIDDPGYIVQLNTYRKYIETKTNKPVKMYLYSILDNTLKEVKKN